MSDRSLRSHSLSPRIKTNINNVVINDDLDSSPVHLSPTPQLASSIPSSPSRPTALNTIMQPITHIDSSQIINSETKIVKLQQMRLNYKLT